MSLTHTQSQQLATFTILDGMSVSGKVLQQGLRLIKRIGPGRGMIKIGYTLDVLAVDGH